MKAPDEEIVRETLQARALDALTANKAYLTLKTPTAQQQAVQVERLTRQQTALIRLLLGALDGTD